MLHLQAKVKRGSNFCRISYENPLNNVRKPYLLKLHSVYSTANETGIVKLPVTYTVQDSPYIAYVEHEINNEKLIKEYAQDIATKFAETSNSRIVRTLKSFSPEIPKVEIKQASDTDVTARYFNLLLPKNTYLFSNNKYALYALGFDDVQILEIDNSTETTGLASHLVEPTTSFDSTDISKIFIVENNKETGYLPSETIPGNIKWIETDKFSSVYFPTKRQRRSQQIIHPNPSRLRRSVAESPEDQLELDEDYDIPTKRQKLDTRKIWDNRALNLNLEAVTNFDFTPLSGATRGRSEADTKEFWRNSIITAINQSSSNQATLKIPSEYINDIRKDEFIKVFERLQTDEKSYVQIATTAALYKFYDLLSKSHKETKIRYKNNKVFESKYDKLQKSAFEKKNLYLGKLQTLVYTNNSNISRISKKLRLEEKLQNAAEVDTDPGTEGGDDAAPLGQSLPNDNSPIGNEGGTEDSEEEKSSATGEEEEEKVTLRVTVTDALVDKLVDNLQDINNATTRLKDEMDDYEAKIRNQSNLIKDNLDTSISLYNDLFSGMTSATSLTEAQILIFVDKIEIEQGNAHVEMGKISQMLNEIEHSITEQTKTHVDADSLKEFINAEEKPFSVEQKFTNELPQANFYLSSIETSLALINDSNDRIKSIKNSEIDNNIQTINKIALDGNYVYNKKKSGEAIIVPDPPSLAPPPVQTPPQPQSPPPTAPSPTQQTPQPQAPPPKAPSPTPPQSPQPSLDEGPETLLDERNEPNAKILNKYVIGFIHFANPIFPYTMNVNIDANSNATTISRDLGTQLRLVLQTMLNLSFCPNAEKIDNKYRLYTNNALRDNKAEVALDFEDERSGYMLRLTNAGFPNMSIKMTADTIFSIMSDDFSVVNPFLDNFKKHLPLILTPINAGPTNSYSSNIGETSSLGIVDQTGVVKDATTIQMRPSRRENFSIYFYTPFLFEKHFDHDFLLYFHFLIKPV